MSEDFNPSPRASKRRKVSKYGSSRPAHPENGKAVSSIWDNVSNGVTYLSRSLFEGSKSKTRTRPDDSAHASHEDTLGDEEAQAGGHEDPEIAESEDELASDVTSTESRRGSHRAQSPKIQTSTANPRTKTVNEDSSECQSSQKETASGAKKRQRGAASRSTSGQFPEPDENASTNIKPGNNTDAVETEDAGVDSITVQQRSSGRERKRTRKYSVEPVEIQETPKSTTQPSSKAGIIKQRSGGKKTMKQPKLVGILTPSKRNEKKARKSVVFDDSEKQIESDLGFKDISSSTKKSQTPVSEQQQSFTAFSSLKKSKKKPREDAVVTQSVSECENHADTDLLLVNLPAPVLVIEDPHSEQDQIDLLEDSSELERIKASVLARLTHRAAHAGRPPLPSYLKSAYETLHTLLQATVSSGESNSLLLLGSRGSGKSLLMNTALDELQRTASTDFHVVRLNGFVQTDDRLALREIWRQLGREMEVDEDETNQVVGSYADTMTSLLGLLSQPEEVPDIGAVEYAAEKVVTKSVVFVLDEFDLFTTHQRQTLLYNLFDIAQSRKAPIAVIGCSARTDCVECLEKRVKSRFSHRWVHVGQPKSLAEFKEVATNSLLVYKEGDGLENQEQERAVEWNEYITSTFLPSPSVQSLISAVFYTTKSLPDLLTALYIPIATATISTSSPSVCFSDPPSLIGLLPPLPHIHLALLICATRLEAIHSLTQLNFNIVYAHYTDLLTKSRLAASASGATTSGMRPWGRDVSLKAWEELVRWELLVKVGGKDEGMGGDGRMYRIDVSIEEVRWAVEKLGTGVGEGLARWCKEI